MVSTYTANKRIEQPGFNDYVDTWDVPVNNDWAIIDLALGGSVSINTTGLSGNQTLGTAQYQPLKIVLTGAPTGAINYRVPSGVGGIWVVRNNTTGGQTVTIDSAAGGSAITIPANQNTLVTCDGSASGMFLAINTSPVAAGLTTQVQYNDSGVLAGSAKFVFDGTTVTVSGLSVTGATVLGDASGDTITVNAATAAIPNGLNIGSNNLFLSGTKVGIGTATLGAEPLTVAGVIYSTAGGIKFPDGTTQTSAAAVVAGSNTYVQFNDGGVFGGQANFNFVKGTGVLSVPSLVLTTPLAVTSGGTGSTTATGTGAVVRATSPSIASPALTGTPTTPTAAAGTSTTQIASTAFVQTAVGAKVAFRAMTDGVGAPGAFSKMTLANAAVNQGGYWNNGTQRFTPPAGIYAIQIGLTCAISNSYLELYLYKNGAPLAYAYQGNSQTWNQNVSISITDQANGTDYYEAYWAGGAISVPPSINAWFSAMGIQL